MENAELTLRTSVSGAVEAANRIIVKCLEDYEAAGNARKNIKYTLKQIAEYWEPKKDQAFKLHKSLVAAEKEMTAPLEQADKIIDSRMGEYRREQERIRQEEERERWRREEEARKAAEEAARLAAEAGQKDELDDDDCELLRMAQADVERAELAVDAAPPLGAPLKMQGISVRKVWKARVVNDALVPVSVAGIVIRPIDQSALNKLAAASSGRFECPGVAFYQEEVSQVRI
jgi:hypothetical protein